MIVQANNFNIKKLRAVKAIFLPTNLMPAEAITNIFIDKESSTTIISLVGEIDKARLSEKIWVPQNSDMLEIDDGRKLILSLK